MKYLVIVSLFLSAITFGLSYRTDTASAQERIRTQRDAFDSKRTDKNKFLRSDDPAPGRYIVTFMPETSLRMSSEHETVSTVYQMAGEYGTSVEDVFTSAIRGFSAEMTEQQAMALSQDDRVLFVEEDSYTYPTGVQSSSDWGLDRIDQRDLPLNGAFMYSHTGAGVNVYVVDSGIRPTHEDFGGRATIAYDALSDGQNGMDCTGHGTHVAGTIGSSTYGVAKNASLYGVRVLPCSGPGLVSRMIAGINWITANHNSPAIINISITVTNVSQSLNNAIENAVNAGIPVVTSAGNYGADACNYSPGSASSAIVVGAIGDGDAKMPYSNYGSCVDIFAPGNAIRSLSHLNDTQTRVMSGTSMAAPMVTGAAALFLEANPGASPSTVANRIKLDATQGMVSNIDTLSPNKILYTWLGDTEPPVPGSVTIIKEVQTLDGSTSSSEVFTYNATNLGTDTFSLIGDDGEPDNRLVNPDIFLFDEQNAISVIEEQKPGWTLTDIVCSETSPEGMPHSYNSSTSVQDRRANIVIEEGESVTCIFRSQQLAPTSAPASVSGRVMSNAGYGVRNVRITITDMVTGQSRATMTNAFGYYSFDSLPTTHLYTVYAKDSRRSQFVVSSHTFNLYDNMTGLDFYMY
ncbi:MAG: S8 family serine peptidase [Acidobacteria bacterium]|nr:S8 family serine peptidase [Acidobacteriota bacterium]